MSNSDVQFSDREALLFHSEGRPGKIEIIASNSWNNKTLSDLDLRGKYGINIVAIKRGMDVNISPESDDIIYAKDILVVIGEIKKINKMSEANE